MRGLEIPQYPGAGGPAVGGYPGGVAGVTGVGAGVGGGGGGGLIGSGVRCPSVHTLTGSSSPSLSVSTVQERSLTIQSGMKAICTNMMRQDSGLEVRDRMWLKINIPQAFIGEYSTKIVTP